jgi:hypothetical protein
MARTARLAVLIAASVALAPAGAPPTRAQSALPQAWLFGTWTGGLFPAPTVLSAQECLAQPVVIFTRDIVMRAIITDQYYTQRLVETARVTGNGVEFRFAPSPAPAQQGPFSLSQSTGETGFGCENPDVLHVRRISEEQITFPGCPEFPYPLVRCPAR